jgi:hypothetical protein
MRRGNFDDDGRGIDLDGKIQRLCTPNSSINRDWVFEEKEEIKGKGEKRKRVMRKRETTPPQIRI